MNIHEKCLEHGQHAGGTIKEPLRNQVMAVNGKMLKLPQIRNNKAV